MILTPPRATPTYTLFPYTPLFRSSRAHDGGEGAGDGARVRRQDQQAAQHVGQAHERHQRRRDLADPPDPADDHDAHQHSEHEPRSEEHTSELQSLMRTTYAVFCFKKKHNENTYTQ